MSNFEVGDHVELVNIFSREGSKVKYMASLNNTVGNLGHITGTNDGTRGTRYYVKWHTVDSMREASYLAHNLKHADDDSQRKQVDE